jgi:hypothetical protein
MIHNFFAGLRAHTSNDLSHSRRRNMRRACDQCVAVIHGQTFPVLDWSMGGIQIMGDDRLFSTGREVDITVKYKLRNKILDIPVRAQIVRKGSQRVALAFEPLTSSMRRNFQHVIDDNVALQFADSQS